LSGARERGAAGLAAPLDMLASDPMLDSPHAFA
jgi:hypothetical protein